MRYFFYLCAIRGGTGYSDGWGNMRPNGWTERGWRRAKRRGCEDMAGVYDRRVFPSGGPRAIRMFRYGLTRPPGCIGRTYGEDWSSSTEP